MGLLMYRSITFICPCKCVHLLLGNDLAGDKVVVNSILTNTPCEVHLNRKFLIFTLHVLLQGLWQRKSN